MEVVNVPLTQITVSELNTRKDLQAGTEDVSLSDLADSIRQEGLMHPVTVRHLGAEQFDLIAGQRRFLACQQIGWTTIPAVIRDDLDATQAVVLSLLENVQRADMNPMDKARAFQRMHDDMGSYEEVARRTRVSAFHSEQVHRTAEPGSIHSRKSIHLRRRRWRGNTISLSKVSSRGPRKST